MSNKNSTLLDQYYTSSTLASYFMDKIKSILPYSKYDILLEPSAGTGSFFSLLDSRRIGLDLDPKYPEVQNMNFYEFSPPNGKRILTIGNPPFGKNSSEAVKFFNNAAKFSEAICFVIPRTFRKVSVSNRLDLNFELIFDETVPDDSFIFEGKTYNVPCCMQIWVKSSSVRQKISTKSFKDVEAYFSIVPPCQSDFSVQRVGAGAGTIRTDNRLKYSKESNWFIKSKVPGVYDIFTKLNFDNVKYNTAGNPSISPGEMIELFLDQAMIDGLHGI